jgi:ribonuclease-3 family protein
MQEYRLSTGFEALIGYVYLKGDQQRLQELFDLSEEII